MPEPISSNSAPSAAFCDPNVACCEEPERVAVPGNPPASSSASPLPQQATPNIVTIPPVHITGSLEKDLVKRYDKQVTQGCANERNAMIVGCANVGGAVVDKGVGTAGTSSFACAQLITAYDGCKQVLAQKLEFADRCEDLHGYAVPGLRPNEAICVPNP